MSSLDPLAPLRRDVDFLASTLGSTIAEQEGAGLLESVERIRLLARAAREHSGAPAREALLNAVRELGEREQGLVVRAFSFYFLLVNLAEQHHRIRRLRHEAASGGARRDPLGEAIAAIRAAGVSEELLRERASGMRLEPVLTAHPTEAARRTYLQSQLRLGRLLDALDDPRAAPDERRAAERAVAEETTVLWQTDEVRSIRPSVDDEIRQGLWFFETSLLDVTADLVALLDERAARARLAAARSSARGSAATRMATRTPTPDQIANALGRARDARAAALPRRGARARPGDSASPTRWWRSTTSCAASIAHDERELPWVHDETAARNRHEPYRRKLTAIWRRLDNELAGRDEPGYAARGGARSRPRPGRREPAAPRRRAHRRRPAGGAAPAVAALRAAHRAARRARPRRAGARARRRAARDARRGRAAQDRHGREALDTVVLSGTASADDVLATYALADAAGCDISVAPLFETIADLANAPGILDELLHAPALARRLDERATRA